MGRVGQQPSREVLPADDRRPRTFPRAGAALASPRRSDCGGAATQIAGTNVSLGPGWRRLLRLSFGGKSIERDVDDELAFHLAMREEKLRRLGLAPDAARVRAQDRFGNMDAIRNECVTIDRQYAREVRLMEWLESIGSDFKYALRMFRRMPTLTAVATITLALGIGATTAMFTLVNSILLRPLPYPESDRIVRVIQSYPEIGLDTWGLNQMNIAM